MFSRRKRRWFFYICIGVTLFFFINRFILSFSQVSQYIYSSVLYPVLLTQKYISMPIKRFIQSRKTHCELEIMVGKLSKKNEMLVQENISLRATASYYDSIKEIVDFKRRYRFKDLKLAHIIFKNIDKKAQFVLINRGSLHGIKVDMVAIYKNFLLGKTSEVYPFYSKVLLITDKSCKVAAYCQGTKANGIHVGSNAVDQSCLERVSHLSTVCDGDLILSSGDGLVFPQGFALGRISSVKSCDLYYQIKVEPMFDINNIDDCFVIKKGTCLTN